MLPFGAREVFINIRILKRSLQCRHSKDNEFSVTPIVASKGFSTTIAYFSFESSE